MRRLFTVLAALACLLVSAGCLPRPTGGEWGQADLRWLGEATAPTPATDLLAVYTHTTALSVDIRIDLLDINSQMRVRTGQGIIGQCTIRQKITRPAYQVYIGERIPTQIRFDNDASETRTVIEIETEDRVGLLYAISETLTGMELDISAAKISTERGAAIDSFYVREVDGGKILADERRRNIERKLRDAISALDSVAS